MMLRVVGTAINNRLKQLGHAVVSVMNRDAPDVDQDKQQQILQFVQWENKRVNVVRQALKKPIDRVKRVRGKRRRDFPQVVGFMKHFVDCGNMQPPMDPVDGAVGEHQKREKGQRKETVAVLAGVIVQFAVAAHLSQEQQAGRQAHSRHGRE